jgi:hypothetical protein
MIFISEYRLTLLAYKYHSQNHQHIFPPPQRYEKKSKPPNESAIIFKLFLIYIKVAQKHTFNI